MRWTFAALFAIALSSTPNVSSAVSNEAAPSGIFEILVRRPDFSVRWKTPRSLLWSMIKEPLTEAVGRAINSDRLKEMSSFGHVAGHISCKGSGARATYDVWFDYTGDMAEEGANLLKREDSGYAVLFHTFTDGALEFGDDVKSEFKRLSYYKGRKPHVLQFLIDAQQCVRAQSILERWKSMRPMRYGFALDPLRFEGAACSNLITSFLPQLGIRDVAFDRWTRHLQVPARLIGTGFPGEQAPLAPTKKNASTIRYRVSLFDILNPFAVSGWGSASEPSRKVSIVDPLLMWKFIDSAEQCVGGKCNSRRMQQWVAAHHVRSVRSGGLTGIQLGR